MKQEIRINDVLCVKDKIPNIPNSPIRGVIEINRRNKITGETEFVYKGENVITISGYQYILEKIFDLYLDSKHNNGYEKLDKDTNLVIPDLNDNLGIGQPSNDYTSMVTNIAENHFIQGFMVGNGGAGEDSITSKNTNYSFINLRNPIPFQQSQGSLIGDKMGKYVGVMNVSGIKEYFIKKFDETPHIYHSWWSDGQAWDTVKPVSPQALGPDAQQAVTTRIETYAECILSIDDTDFKSYFEHAGQTNTAMINELGLVAFDTKNGGHSEIEELYKTKIHTLLYILFDNQNDPVTKDALADTLRSYATDIRDALIGKGSSHIASFVTTMNDLSNDTEIDVTDPDTLQTYRDSLCDTNNIGVEALYNQRNKLQYVTDHFMEYVNDEISFDTEDEAQRIRLITYYTFNSIPIEQNWELLINYRLYAN